jgi:hypothetical protein
VRVAIRKISSEMATFASPAIMAPGGVGEAIPLGEFSDELAMLIPSAEGTGAGPTDRQGRGGRASSPRARVVQAGPSEFAIINHESRVVVPFLVRHRPGTTGSRVSASASVVLDDGSFESQLDIPANAQVPTVIGWIDPFGALRAGSEVVVPADSVGAWKLVTSVVGEASVGVSVEAEPVDSAAGS